MWNTPSAERLARLPRLYETEQVGLQDKLIHLHFFIGGCDWYAIEFDGQDTFWGFAILNGDNLNAEWGYFSLTELQQIRAGRALGRSTSLKGRKDQPGQWVAR